MEVTDNLITDLVRIQQGWWMKDGDGVRRFVEFSDREGKNLRLRKGDSVESTKTKVMAELSIDTTKEKIELTYQMPEWMDVDGTVQPGPIHIITDDDMDMFLAMRVDIHEMKLLAVPMPLNMTLEIDGFKVVPVVTDYSFGEVMSKDELAREVERRAAKDAIDNVICTQLPRDDGAGGSGSALGWLGNTYLARGFPTLSAAARHYRYSENEETRTGLQ
ncbi:unnamed protein product [Arabidopsis halleri]